MGDVNVSYTRQAVVDKLREFAQRNRELGQSLGNPSRSPRAAEAFGKCIAFELAAEMVLDIKTLEDSL